MKLQLQTHIIEPMIDHCLNHIDRVNGTEDWAEVNVTACCQLMLTNQVLGTRQIFLAAADEFHRVVFF